MTEADPLKEVGFFRSADALSAARTFVEQHWEQAAISYLKQGPAIVVSGRATDLLDETEGIGQYQVRTDGEWVWPSTLAYYVAKYHVALPEEFLAHMASRGWQAPELDYEALEELDERYWRQAGPSGPSDEDQ